MITQPICSIILVSYNNFDTITAPCLQSLRQDEAEMEIIIVDNKSDDYTKSQLKQFAKTDSRVRLCFNEKNRGYAGGNNDGVQLAASDIVILLNNDTIVPAGAMKRLSDLLRLHPDWHMLGPVTNASGNEQRIFTTGTKSEEIIQQGNTWCTHSQDFHFSTDLLGFFCVAIRKQTYEQLSGLDESFGLGFYEDTDFCHRAAKAGMNMIITEDIFIYHQGSATFSKSPGQTKKLLRTNRKRFREKHGTLPLSTHVRDKNLQALERYRTNLDLQKNIIGIPYRAANRLQVAEQLQPNNPLKKYLYNQRLKTLQRFFNKSF